MTGAGADPGADRERRVLGGVRELRPREVSRSAGVSLRSARRFWRALGFPEVEDDLPAFTTQDVAALARVSGFVREGLVDDVVALGLTRAVGRSADRMAAWQVQLIAEALAERRVAGAGTDGAGTDGAGTDRVDGARADAPLGDEVARLLARMADDLEPLVVYAWRRHLASAVERMASDHADAAGLPVLRRVVGFADLVSFTRMVRRLSERQLAVLVQRFEQVASDVVSAHGGRIVKTVGDEVLFAAWPPADAAAIALEIADEMATDPLLPDVRVGMASGDVVARLGDVFGTTVNRAARLTALARPGTVLVDEAVAEALEGSAAFVCSAQRRRSLKGLGAVSPWRLERRAAAVAPAGARALGARRDG